MRENKFWVVQPHAQWVGHGGGGREARGSSQEAAYLRTDALGLVQGDDHVGHDEEGVFLLWGGQRGDSTAMLPSGEPSEALKEASHFYVTCGKQ